MAATVSIIIPSYQGVERLPGLLNALVAQDTDTTFEVVLVLDGSTDDSAEVASRFHDLLDLRVIDRGLNLGRSATLNEGFASAVGEVLVRCDDDLLPSPDYVDRFVRWFKRDRRTGVIGLYRNVYPDTAYASAYGRYVDKRFRSEAYTSPATTRWRYWAGNCAVHRSMWDLVGPYDAETFQTYGWEDVDWGYRFQIAGGQIVLDPELETIHRVAATTSVIRTDRARRSGSAARSFDTKHGTHSLASIGGVWGAMVQGLSALPSERLSAAIDKALPHFSDRLGMRIVDLAIQASFRRGYTAPPN